MSPRKRYKADDDVFNVTEVNTKEWKGRNSGGSIGFSGRGMY